MFCDGVLAIAHHPAANLGLCSSTCLLLRVWLAATNLAAHEIHLLVWNMVWSAWQAMLHCSSRTFRHLLGAESLIP
jgi:hypothetical protein